MKRPSGPVAVRDRVLIATRKRCPRQSDRLRPIGRRHHPARWTAPGASANNSRVGSIPHRRSDRGRRLCQSVRRGGGVGQRRAARRTRQLGRIHLLAMGDDQGPGHTLSLLAGAAAARRPPIETRADSASARVPRFSRRALAPPGNSPQRHAPGEARHAGGRDRRPGRVPPTRGRVLLIQQIRRQARDHAAIGLFGAGESRNLVVSGSPANSRRT